MKKSNSILMFLTLVSSILFFGCNGIDKNADVSGRWFYTEVCTDE